MGFDVGEVLEQRERERAPDDRAGRQDLLRLFAEPLEPPTDDEPHAFGNVELVDREVRSEFAGLVEDLPFFGEVPEDLLDEEWVAFGLRVDRVDDRRRGRFGCERFDHRGDAVAVEAVQREAFERARAEHALDACSEGARHFELDITVRADAEDPQLRHE